MAIAPALNGRPTPKATENEHTMSFTCVTCTRRKVKCDKTAPVCSTCRKARLECEWQEPAPRKRKRKAGDEVQQALLEKVERYERVLKENDLMPSKGSDSSIKASPSEGTPLDSHPAAEPSAQSWYMAGQGKLLTGDGKTRYIDSNIWRHLNEEDLNPSSDEEDDAGPQSAGGQRSFGSTDPISASLTGAGSPPQSLIHLHPTYDAAMKLWKIYGENVDPIVKVVHIPSGLSVVQRGAANPSSLSRGTEALLFAIYHFAIISMSDLQCLELLGQARAGVQAQYYEAMLQALVNAHFLRTTEIAVFQAYILFLISVRIFYDPHTFWILTGVAVRIAYRMGLHRDGEELGLKPFDVELRRRIFWQVLPLDGLSAQLAGTGVAISSDAWDVKQPLNINDTDIWPEMTEPPQPRTGATDMIFCLARTEIGKFHKKANPSLSSGNWAAVWAGKDIFAVEDLMLEVQEIFETKYLRYCDFVNPLHCLTMAMCRAASTSGRLRVRLSLAKHKGRMSDEERRELRDTAMKIIEYHIVAQKNPMLSQFRWHLQAFFQWDPLIWILNEIRKDPLAYQDVPIWSKIEAVHEQHPELVAPKRALSAAVGRLTVRAWDAWAFVKTQQDQSTPVEPPGVAALRMNVEEKKSSRSASASTPAAPYNPFNPSGDAMEDLSEAALPPPTTQDPGTFDFNYMLDFNTEAGDWMFWVSCLLPPFNR